MPHCGLAGGQGRLFWPLHAGLGGSPRQQVLDFPEFLGRITHVGIAISLTRARPASRATDMVGTPLAHGS